MEHWFRRKIEAVMIEAQHAMQPLEAARPAPAETGTLTRFWMARKHWVPGAVLLAAWTVLWNKLRVDWATNDQYSYGWFVPPLAIFLLWLRWPDRPVPRGGARGWTLALAAGAGLLLFLPVRLIEEPNADWRLLVWIHAGLLAGVTLAAIAWTGGLPWVRHFGFPVLFLLLAVRWPSGPEQAVVQSLMRVVASIAAEAMNLLGIPATRLGNLIRVRDQVVGVDEACSGIRSLQTMLMAGLFLGEMVRLSVRRRLVLLAGGTILALLANVLRSGWLVWITANHGAEEMLRFHDRAGLSVLVFILLGLVALNNWLERGQKKSRRQPAPADGGSAGGQIGTFPSGWIAGAGVWLFAVEAATAGWYGIHERGLTELPAWTAVPPRDAPGFREVRIDDVSRNLLRFDEARAGAWAHVGEPFAQCTLFFFRWEAGRTSASLSSLHQPHICLTATGMEETGDFGTALCPTGAGVTLPARRYEFVQHGRKIFVFWVVWQNRPDASTLAEEPESRWDRLRPVLRGERNLGQQTLELVMTGPQTADEALGIFSQEMAGSVVRRGR